MTKREEYLLGSSDAERERLTRHSAVREDETVWLLDRVGIQPGWRVVDVGCGPLGILNLLSDRVGPTGQVIGLDNEPRMLEMARASVAGLGLENVQLVQGDAVTHTLPAGSFDFAHARLLLINVANPEAVIGAMSELVRPGGMVAVQEVDWFSWVCEPPHPAWDRLISVLIEVRHARGLDVYVGRRVPGMLRRAGLVDIGMNAVAPLRRPGDPHYDLLLVFAGLHREAIIEGGLCSETELAEVTEAVRTHLNHADTFVIHSLTFQSWGVRPPGRRNTA
jgi:SAM-dependent methyltransferase